GYGIFYDTLAVGDSIFLLGLNPPFVRFEVKNNGPELPQFDLATAFQDSPLGVQPSIFSTSRQLPNPYLQQWSTSLEFPIRQIFLMNLSYFGQKGTRLRRQLNLNQPTQARQSRWMSGGRFLLSRTSSNSRQARLRSRMPRKCGQSGGSDPALDLSPLIGSPARSMTRL